MIGYLSQLRTMISMLENIEQHVAGLGVSFLKEETSCLNDCSSYNHWCTPRGDYLMGLRLVDNPDEKQVFVDLELRIPFRDGGGQAFETLGITYQLDEKGKFFFHHDRLEGGTHGGVPAELSAFASFPQGDHTEKRAFDLIGVMVRFFLSRPTSALALV